MNIVDKLKQYISDNYKHVISIIEHNLEFLRRKEHADSILISLYKRLGNIDGSVHPYRIKNKKDIPEDLVDSIYDLYADVRTHCTKYQNSDSEGCKTITEFIRSDKPHTFNVDDINDSNNYTYVKKSPTNKNVPDMKTKEYYYHASIEPVVVLNETRTVPGEPVLSAEDLNEDDRLITVDQDHVVKTRLVKKIKRDITLCMMVSEREKYNSEEKSKGHYRSYVEIVIGLAVRNPHYDEFDLDRAKTISKGKANKDPIFFETRDSDVSIGQDIKGLPKQLINGRVANKLLARVAKDVEMNFGNYVAAFNNE